MAKPVYAINVGHPKFAVPLQLLFKSKKAAEAARTSLLLAGYELDATIAFCICRDAEHALDMAKAWRR